MNRRMRRGFTLVELLVVITIIGMLMALLLPAVQAAREAGRRATCMNNEKNLSLALLNYESAKSEFPGFADLICVDTSTAGAPLLDGSTNIDGSWVISILPYIERNDLWNIWHDTNPMAGVNRVLRPRVGLGVTMCPSFSPEYEGSGVTNLHYVVNCGWPDVSSVTSAATTDEWATITGGAADPRPGRRADGVFHDHSSYILPANQTSVSLDYVTNNDGSSTTLLLGENVNAETLVSTSVSPSSGALGGYIPLSSTGGRRRIYEGDVGMIWWPWWATPPCPPECAKLNECVKVRPSGVPWQTRIRPGSAHGSVVIMSFCDGHQQMVSDTIDYQVYRHIMSPNGAKATITDVFDRRNL